MRPMVLQHIIHKILTCNDYWSDLRKLMMGNFSSNILKYQFHRLNQNERWMDGWKMDESILGLKFHFIG